jgi:hypothetical protein
MFEELESMSPSKCERGAGDEKGDKKGDKESRRREG